MAPNPRPRRKKFFADDSSPSMAAVRFAVQLIITGLATAIWNGQAKMQADVVEVRRDVAVLKDARETYKEQIADTKSQIAEVKSDAKSTKDKRDYQWNELTLSIAQIKSRLNLSPDE